MGEIVRITKPAELAIAGQLHENAGISVNPTGHLRVPEIHERPVDALRLGPGGVWCAKFTEGRLPVPPPDPTVYPPATYVMLIINNGSAYPYPTIVLRADNLTQYRSITDFSVRSGVTIGGFIFLGGTLSSGGAIRRYYMDMAYSGSTPQYTPGYIPALCTDGTNLYLRRGVSSPNTAIIQKYNVNLSLLASTNNTTYQTYPLIAFVEDSIYTDESPNNTRKFNKNLETMLTASGMPGRCFSKNYTYRCDPQQWGGTNIRKINLTTFQVEYSLGISESINNYAIITHGDLLYVATGNGAQRTITIRRYNYNTMQLVDTFTYSYSSSYYSVVPFLYCDKDNLFVSLDYYRIAGSYIQYCRGVWKIPISTMALTAEWHFNSGGSWGQEAALILV